jgi:hypothetical protein
MEWTLILVLEFGRHFGLTLKQAFNYLSPRYVYSFLKNELIAAKVA